MVIFVIEIEWCIIVFVVFGIGFDFKFGSISNGILNVFGCCWDSNSDGGVIEL